MRPMMKKILLLGCAITIISLSACTDKLRLQLVVEHGSGLKPYPANQDEYVSEVKMPDNVPQDRCWVYENVKTDAAIMRCYVDESVK